MGGSTGMFRLFSKNTRCQVGPLLGLAGVSRYFNRVPRALLVIMDWSTAKNKPSGAISDRFWTNICYLYVIYVLPVCYCLFGFRPWKAVNIYFLMKSGLLWLSASYLLQKQGL